MCYSFLLLPPPPPPPPAQPNHRKPSLTHTTQNAEHCFFLFFFKQTKPLTFIIFSLKQHKISPWYNHTGWLGTKHQVTSLLTQHKYKGDPGKREYNSRHSSWSSSELSPSPQSLSPSHFQASGMQRPEMLHLKWPGLHVWLWQSLGSSDPSPQSLSLSQRHT